MHRIHAIVAILLAAAAASDADAQIYRITVTDTVGSNIAGTGTRFP